MSAAKTSIRDQNRLSRPDPARPVLTAAITYTNYGAIEDALPANGSESATHDNEVRAWLILAACSLMSAPIWGFSMAFGVLQEHYASHPDGHMRNINGSTAIIGTTASGLLYLCCPLVFPLLAHKPALHGPVMWFGLVLATGGLALSSMCGSFNGLVATQGVAHAIGGGLLFASTTLRLDGCFGKRKGMAYGTLWAAKSVFGATLPYLMGFLLERFGWRVTTQIWAAGLVVVSVPLLYIIDSSAPSPDPPLKETHRESLLGNKILWIYGTGNLAQSLGYFLPTAYLSSYVVSQGHSPLFGTTLLAIFNATSIIGSFVVGALCDSFTVELVVLLCSVGSGLAVFVFWGFESDAGMLVVFAAMYGVFAGGYSSTWSGMQRRVEESLADGGIAGGAPSVFGLLAGARGVGNVLSGPLSIGLLRLQGLRGSGWHCGFSSEYGVLIAFTGVTALLGALPCCTWSSRGGSRVDHKEALLQGCRILQHREERV